MCFATFVGNISILQLADINLQNETVKHRDIPESGERMPVAFQIRAKKMGDWHPDSSHVEYAGSLIWGELAYSLPFKNLFEGKITGTDFHNS